MANVSTPSLVLNFEDLLPITFNKRQRSQLTLVLLFVEEELECFYFRDTKFKGRVWMEGSAKQHSSGYSNYVGSPSLTQCTF